MSYGNVLIDDCHMETISD